MTSSEFAEQFCAELRAIAEECRDESGAVGCQVKIESIWCDNGDVLIWYRLRGSSETFGLRITTSVLKAERDARRSPAEFASVVWHGELVEHFDIGASHIAASRSWVQDGATWRSM